MKGCVPPLCSLIVRVESIDIIGLKVIQKSEEENRGVRGGGKKIGKSEEREKEDINRGEVEDLGYFEGNDSLKVFKGVG